MLWGVLAKVGEEANEQGLDGAYGLTIHGDGGGEFILRKDGVITQKLADPAAELLAEVTFDSPQTFLALAERRISPQAAFLKGRLRLKGDMRHGRRLIEMFHAATAKKSAATTSMRGSTIPANPIDSSFAASPAALERRGKALPRERWQPDGPACAACEVRFRVYRRRHHCRHCGRLLCAACAPRRLPLGGDRACGSCILGRATGGGQDGRGIALAAGINGGGGGEGGGSGGEQAALELLQSRLFQLEEQIEAMDASSFAAKAAALRYAVAAVHFSLLGCAALLLAVLAHFAAALAAAILPAVSSDSLASALSAVLPLSAFSVVSGVTPATALSAPESAPPTGDLKFWPVAAEEEEDGSCHAPMFAAAEPVAVYRAALTLQVFLALLLRARGVGRLASRRIYTFLVAAAVIGGLRAARIVAQQKRNGAETDAWWRWVHRLLGPFLYETMVRLKGVWVKCGQYLSSRADIMPEPVVRELSRLQDSVPASPFSSVRRILEAELGQPVAELFATLDESALASASIAQVHRATLRASDAGCAVGGSGHPRTGGGGGGGGGGGDGGGSAGVVGSTTAAVAGEQVVVKVQHPEVRELLLADLKNLRVIVRFVAWCDKAYDFRPIMNEWIAEAKKELDFRQEAANLERVGKAMRDSKLDVVIPSVVPRFTTTRVLVMSFCEGIKVTDAAALAAAPRHSATRNISAAGTAAAEIAASLDRPALLRTVCEAFAYQIHMDGLFNADPHPGNILLQRYVDPTGTARVRPVLLDWGLAKALPDHLRLAFCGFVFAASEQDFVSMLRSFEDMGIKLNRFDPAEDMRNIRFLLRDTAPPDEARRDIRAFHRKIHKKMRRERPPVDAYPGELLFFIRVTELLHGLGSRLRVNLPYLEVMARYARQALIERVPPNERCRAAIWPSPLLSPLEGKVRALLTEMVATGEVLGCQVACFIHGKKLVDTCAGQQGTVDPRPVTPATLFCCFSVSKAIAATALHLLVDSGEISYDTKIATVWPEFAQNRGNGKEMTTVKDVLTHSTGLQHALPATPTVEALCDWNVMVRAMEEATPLYHPGTRSCYHYFSFGFLAGAIVEKVLARRRQAAVAGSGDGNGGSSIDSGSNGSIEGSGGSQLSEFIRARIFEPLGLGGEAFFGDAGSKGAINANRIATIEHSLYRDGAAAHAAAAAAAGEDDEEDFAEHSEDNSGENSGMLGVVAAAVAEQDPVEGAGMLELALKLKGREYLLDPRLFNHRPVQLACIPSANGLFTARALATISDNFLASLRPAAAAAAVPALPLLPQAGSAGGGGGSSITATAEEVPGVQAELLLSRARVDAMRRFAAKDQSPTLALFGMPRRQYYGLGFQLFGFAEPLPGPSEEEEVAAVRFSRLVAAAGGSLPSPPAAAAPRADVLRRAAVLASAGERPASATATPVRRSRSSVAAVTPAASASAEATTPARNGRLAAAAAVPVTATFTSVAAAATGRPAAAAGTRVRLSGFGHTGVGGSFMLCDSASGLAMAVTVNKVTADRGAPMQLLRLVCAELGIGEPAAIFASGD